MFKFILLRDALDLKEGTEFRVDTESFSYTDKGNTIYSFKLKELLDLESKGWVRKEDDEMRLVSKADYNLLQSIKDGATIIATNIKDSGDFRTTNEYWEGFKRGVDVMYNLIRGDKIDVKSKDK